MMAFSIVGAVIGIQVGRWAIGAGLTTLDAVLGMAYANILYGIIPRFALAVGAWDIGLLLSVLAGLLINVALVFMAGLGFFEQIGFAASWAGRTAAWPILMGQLALAIISGMMLIFAPGGLKASGCLP